MSQTVFSLALQNMTVGLVTQLTVNERNRLITCYHNGLRLIFKR